MFEYLTLSTEAGNCKQSVHTLLHGVFFSVCGDGCRTTPTRLSVPLVFFSLPFAPDSQSQILDRMQG